VAMSDARLECLCQCFPAGDAGRYASLCGEGLIYGCRLQARRY